MLVPMKAPTVVATASAKRAPLMRADGHFVEHIVDDTPMRFPGVEDIDEEEGEHDD